jgi:glutaredoxin-related protein
VSNVERKEFELEDLENHEVVKEELEAISGTSKFPIVYVLGRFLGDDKDQIIKDFEEGVIARKLDKAGIKHRIGKEPFDDLVPDLPEVEGQ